MQKKPSDYIVEIGSVSSSNEKKKILKEAFENSCFDLFVGLNLAYNPLVTFGVKKIPLIDQTDDGYCNKSFSDFIDLANLLKSRKLTGNAAKKEIANFASESSVDDWNNFYRLVLGKDMKSGITSTTVNNVLNDIGGTALSYLIPSFECQLAKDVEGHPKKLKGKKLLDIKLDGARMLAVLDKEKNMVSMFTRNGLEQNNFPKIQNMLQNIIPDISKSLVFDGEILSDTFQNLMSQFSKKDAATDDMKLGVFDVIPLDDFLTGKCEISQADRHFILTSFQTDGLFRKHCGDFVYAIPKMEVNLDTEAGKKEMENFFLESVEAGFEGIMIKDPDAPYVAGKGTNWLKKKPKISVTLKVIDLIEGKPETKYVGTLGSMLLCGIDEIYGKEYTIQTFCGSGLTDAQRNLWWAKPELIRDHLVEVEADAVTIAKDGKTHSLRFAVFKGLRGTKPDEKI